MSVERPNTPPDAATLPLWREFALAYLREQFGPHAPRELGEAAFFDGAVLEGDGRVAVLPFTAAPGGGESAEFWVVVGQTEPNYYPRWGLSVDDAFRVHLGTRFMLVLGVAQTDGHDYDPRDDVLRMLAQVAPGEALDSVSLAAMFRVGDQRHAVARVCVGGVEAYAMTADCPPGFSTRVDLAPHVVYRLHLGSLLLMEHEDERRAARRDSREGPAGALRRM